MHVVVPKLMDTGFVVKNSAPNVDVQLDLTSNIQQLLSGEISQLSWKATTEKGTFIYIARAWCWRFFGVRKIRVQCHKLYEDGTRGPRIIIWERVNGKHTR